MKINLTPLFKLLDSMTIYRIFFSVIVLPSCVGFLTMYMMQHEGTQYLATHEAEMDISIGGAPKGSFVVALFGNTVPLTVKNFEAFATKGHQGFKYEGTTIHRVVKGFVIQGGDVMKGSGDPEGQEGQGRISIYGKTFDDENFAIKHAAPGFVSMANSGPNTNGCQFFITVRAASFLDGKHVIFGKVVKNIELVELISNQDTDEKERPIADVVITRMQMNIIKSPYYISDDPYNIWSWAWFIFFPVCMCLVICIIFNYLMKYIDRGIEVEEAIEKMYKKHIAKGGQGKKTGEEMDDNTCRRRVAEDEVETDTEDVEEEVPEDDTSKPHAT